MTPSLSHAIILIQPMQPRYARWSVVSVALLGTAAWYVIPRAVAPVPMCGWLLSTVAFFACVVPPIRTAITYILTIIQSPSAPSRATTALLIATIASLYLTFTATLQDRDFFPKTLDDQSYVIQMHMLAHGKLWMPEHPCADFFDTFHILVRPKYASAYFPGTALLYTPLLLLGAPVWLGPVIAAGASVGLLYRVVTELVDGVAGLLAAILLVACSWFRTYSILVYGQPVALMLGLLMFWGFLHWRQSPRWNWAMLIGIIGGLLAITRPADAVCYGLPIAVVMGLSLRGRERVRKTLVTFALIIAGSLPFLAIQLIQNVGITGSIFKTPFSLYLDRDQPGASFGFHAYDPNARPASIIPEKQIYYQQFIVPFIKKHTLGQTGAWLKEHLPQMADVTLPARMMLLFVPIGLLGLGRDARRWALVATFLLFLLIYFGYPPFVEHYALPFAPAVILCVAMAPSVLRESIPRAGSAIYSAAILVIVIVSVSMLPELNRKVDDETFRSPMMRVIHDRIDNSDLAPAVILFRFADNPNNPDDSANREPVYNTDVAWPDDAPIIRAHDLGARNIEIFRYYAHKQPQRVFYLFDRGNLADPLHRLGTAAQLANGK